MSGCGCSGWRTISALSFTAFGLLGLGILFAAIGISAPRWLRISGIVVGELGIAVSLSGVVPALDFLPGPFSVCLLAWIVTLDVRGAESLALADV